MSHRSVDIARKLRRKFTDIERRLWGQLRAHRFDGVKFKRQQPIGPFIVDFVSLKCRVVIEVDGGQHCDNESDSRRDAYLESRGFRVLRFWNNEVSQNLTGVMARIAEAVAPSPLPLSREGRGE